MAFALGLALFVLVGIPAVLYFVHYEIMPLDLLIDRVAARIGL